MVVTPTGAMMNVETECPLILLAITLLSGGALWFRYQEGKLLTPSGGLHLQIFLFFGIGGFCYILFPATDFKLTEDAIWHYTYVTSVPFLMGYAIAFAFEYLWGPRLGGKSTSGQNNEFNYLGSIFQPFEFFIVSLLGSIGFFLQYVLEGSIFGQLGTYLGLLFFPSILIGIADWRKMNLLTRIITVILLIQVLLVGFYSAWRSMLIILIVTILLGVSVSRKKKVILGVVGVGFIVLCYIIPFQILKRHNMDEFERDPINLIVKSLDIPFSERVDIIGEFFASRLNYTRELVYVEIAVERGFNLRAGETYLDIISQLVPRILWEDKPDVAYWAGYVLPRKIGLLDRSDHATSWAVNMFAEAAYNFGTWSVVWFVPIAFAFTGVLQRQLSRWYSASEAIALGNIACFYLILETTTVIFTASLIVALFLIIKVFEIWLHTDLRATTSRAH